MAVQVNFKIVDAPFSKLQHEFSVEATIQNVKEELLNMWPTDAPPLHGVEDLRIVAAGRLTHSQKCLSEYGFRDKERKYMHVQLLPSAHATNSVTIEPVEKLPAPPSEQSSRQSPTCTLL
jgi:hypothetical protein